MRGLCPSALTLGTLLWTLMVGRQVRAADMPDQGAATPKYHERCHRGELTKRAELKRLQDFVAGQQQKGGPVDPTIHVQIRVLQQEIANWAQNPGVVACEEEEAKKEAESRRLKPPSADEMAAMGSTFAAAKQVLATFDEPPKPPTACRGQAEALQQVVDLETAPDRGTVEHAKRLLGLQDDWNAARRRLDDCEAEAEDSAKAATATAPQRKDPPTSRRSFAVVAACLGVSDDVAGQSKQKMRDGSVVMLQQAQAKTMTLLHLDRRDVVQGAVVLVQQGGDLEAGAKLYFKLGACLTGLDRAQVAKALLQPELAKFGGAYFRTVKTTIAKFAIAWTEREARELAKD